MQWSVNGKTRWRITNWLDEKDESKDWKINVTVFWWIQRHFDRRLWLKNKRGFTICQRFLSRCINLISVQGADQRRGDKTECCVTWLECYWQRRSLLIPAHHLNVSDCVEGFIIPEEFSDGVVVAELVGHKTSTQLKTQTLRCYKLYPAIIKELPRIADSRHNRYYTLSQLVSLV